MKHELSEIYSTIWISYAAIYIILSQHLNDGQFRGFRNEVRYRER